MTLHELKYLADAGNDKIAKKANIEGQEGVLLYRKRTNGEIQELFAGKKGLYMVEPDGKLIIADVEQGAVKSLLLQRQQEIKYARSGAAHLGAEEAVPVRRRLPKTPSGMPLPTEAGPVDKGSRGLEGQG